MMKGELPLSKIAAKTLRYSWAAHPLLFAALIIASIALCALQVFEIYAMKGLFDSVAAYAAGTYSLTDVVYAALPLIALLLLGPLIEIGEYLAQGYYWRIGSGFLQSLFHLHIGKMKFLDFETSATFDEMKKAHLANEEAPNASRTIVQILFYYIPFVISVSAFLYRVKPPLLFALVFIWLPILISQLIRAATVQRFEQQTAGLKRRTEYEERCITDSAFYKETRTLGAFPYFFRRFTEKLTQLNRQTMVMERKVAAIETALRLLNILSYAGILAMLLYYITKGEISVGAFAAVFYSVDKLNNFLKRMVDDIGDALKSLAVTSFLLEFMQKPTDDGCTTPNEKTVDIHIKDVSFAYPNSPLVVSNINLEIKQGETLAIVGENGSGKTTLTKLIMGLYPPTSGAVLYGDQNICSYAPDQRYRGISGVFQNFTRYKMSLQNNIRISDMDSDRNTDEVISKAAVSLARMPKGLETMLSREYGGTELSGGEWQRVAIARGFYRSHDVIVLDEPTAAIDPIEESRVFELFKESSAGKTAILVTHRLGSVKIADKIVVLQKGKMIEYGTHAELMELRGCYFTMFQQQAKWYVEKSFQE